jgi:hypothetical protein
VRWSPAFEDVSPGIDDGPLLNVLPSSAMKTATGNISVCMIVICKVLRVVC